MNIEPWLANIVRCPQCHGTLSSTTTDAGKEWLQCDDSDAHRYEVRSGIPVLLPPNV